MGALRTIFMLTLSMRFKKTMWLNYKIKSQTKISNTPTNLTYSNAKGSPHSIFPPIKM